MASTVVRLEWVAAASAGVLAIGCQSRTEILFGVITDIKAPGALDTVQLIVSDADSGVPILAPPPWMLSGSIDESFNLPGSYGVTSNDGDESPILVDVQGFKDNTLVVDRTAIVTLIDGQTLFYRMGLTAGCAALLGACGSGMTCVEGQCRPEGSDSAQFPAFTADLVDQLTCNSGVTYLDTATDTPMAFAPGAADCNGSLCIEGTCYNPPPGHGTMAPDAGGTGPDGGGLQPTGGHFHYVIDTLTAPASESADTLLHVDANGNPVSTGGTAVNKFGGLVATLATAGGIDLQASLTQDVNTGTIAMLADLQTPDFQAAQAAGFQMFLGDDPSPPACNGSADTTCGHQFGGSATFGIASSSGDAALVGPVAAGTLATASGELTIQYALAFGSAVAPFTVNLHDALVEASSLDATSIGSLVIAGAILETDVNAVVIPSLATAMNSAVAADCTADPGSAACGSGDTEVDCSGASQPHALCCTANIGQLVGDNSLVGLDANNDCVITAQEIGSNGVFQSLLAPDVASTGNGTPDALSFGTAATAVGAVFTAPGE